ncbi:MAG: hypothetical protein AB4063_26145 [Crocosphaera sp.]
MYKLIERVSKLCKRPSDFIFISLVLVLLIFLMGTSTITIEYEGKERKVNILFYTKRVLTGKDLSLE